MLECCHSVISTCIDETAVSDVAVDDHEPEPSWFSEVDVLLTLVATFGCTHEELVSVWILHNIKAWNTELFFEHGNGHERECVGNLSLGIVVDIVDIVAGIGILIVVSPLRLSLLLSVVVKILLCHDACSMLFYHAEHWWG